MTRSLADAIGAANRERVATMALDVTRAHLPDRVEGLRAEVVADFLSHPKIDVHVDPAMPNRPNVIARVRGTRGADAPGLLLNGHLDGGFVETGWRHDPTDPWREGDSLYGGAISDMLGGVASMIETTLLAADAGLPGDVVFLANMYHDSNGLGTKYALASEGGWPRYGVNGEPTQSGILTTHGGCVKFQVDFSGRIAHVSRSEEGRDALSAAVDVYQALRTLDWTHEPDADLSQHPRFVVGVMQAGTAAGAVADTARIQGDMRTVPSQTWQSVRDDLAGCRGPDPRRIARRHREDPLHRAPACVRRPEERNAVRRTASGPSRDLRVRPRGQRGEGRPELRDRCRRHALRGHRDADLRPGIVAFRARRARRAR